MSVGAYADTVTPSDLVALERLRNMRLHREQRETAYLHKLLGRDAATKKRRLRLARMLPTVGLTIGGALAGSVLGGLGSKDGGAIPGAAIGGLLGALSGGTADAIGSAVGNLSSVDNKQLANSVNSLGGLDYLTPGKAAYLQTLLDKSFEENESKDWRPSQVIL
jgi:hypothetical protein